MKNKKTLILYHMRIIPLLLLLFVFNYAKAQTLHAIIFANTESPGDPSKPGDPGIGPSVTVDFERMGIEMTSISNFIGYKLNKYYYYGSQERFNRTNLIRVINNLKCDKDDIVFFYYSGHGGRYANEDTQYPEMILKVPFGPASDDVLYPLYDVYKTIRAKNPRLTIVFGDLCNSTWKNAYKPEQTSRASSFKSESISNVYKNLFLNVKGGLIATSSKPGETSGCASTADGEDAGGIFTCSFLECLGAYASHGVSVNWTNLLNQSKEIALKISEGAQEPVFSTGDLILSAAPNVSISQGQNTPVTDDPITLSMDEIAGSLNYVANGQIRPADRIREISKAAQSFSANAMVQVVGKDSKTIVNTTTAKKYLDYLSIATNMDQVMVLETRKDSNGKISYMKIHEMRK